MANQFSFDMIAKGGGVKHITVTPTLTVHANYAANDYVGTSGAPMTFSNAARVAGGSGLVLGCVVVDGAAQSIAGELWLFDATVTPPADSAAWSISDADAKKCIGVIPTGTYYASALNSVAPSDPAGEGPIRFNCAAASQDIYGCFVTRGAPTYADGDLTFRLAVMQM